MSYEIIRALRDSEIAPVYLGVMPDGSEVVVKTMSVGKDPQTLDRMQRRFDVLAGLEHPGVPRCLELTVADGNATWVHEYIPGDTVHAWVEDGRRFTETEIFDFMAEVLQILIALHDGGVVHRDLKPENIVVRPDGRLVLIDFAGANIHDESGNVSVLGTTGFAAPEQLVGDAQYSSDQYGLAATALQLATGRHPTEFPLRSLRIELEDAGLSRGLEDTLEKMLEPEPSRRFRDAREALEVVRAAGARPTWEWPLTVAEEVEKSVISYETTDGVLTIDLAPRGRTQALTGAVSVLVFTLIATAAGYAYAGSTAVGIVLGLCAFYVVLLALIVVLPEIRRFSSARIRLAGNHWSYAERGVFRRLEKSGTGLLTVTPFQRTMGRGTSAEDTRNSLRLATTEELDIVAAQLWPLEARAVAQAIQTYQQEHRPALPPGTTTHSTETALVTATSVTEIVSSRPPNLVRRFYEFQGRNDELSDEETDQLESELPQAFRAKVAEHGFRRSGGQVERTMYRMIRYKTVQYLSADGAIRLGVGTGGESNSESGVNYSLMTTLESGQQVITYSKTRLGLSPTERVVVTPTLGSLERDIAMHRTVVASSGSTALVMRTNADAVAATTWFDRKGASRWLLAGPLIAVFYALVMGTGLLAALLL